MQRKWLGLVVFACLLAVAIPNLSAWFGHNSALKEADREAIEWLNERVEAERSCRYFESGSLCHEPLYSCTTEVAPWIYSRFTEMGYVEEGGAYVVWRSEPMTPRCDPENVFYKERPEVDVEGLELLEAFESRGVEVRVYEGGQ